MYKLGLLTVKPFQETLGIIEDRRIAAELDITVFEKLAVFTAEVTPSIELVYMNSLCTVSMPTYRNVPSQATRLAGISKNNNLVVWCISMSCMRIAMRVENANIAGTQNV